MFIAYYSPKMDDEIATLPIAEGNNHSLVHLNFMLLV